MAVSEYRYAYPGHEKWLSSEEGIAAVGEVLNKVEKYLRPAGCAMMSAIWPRTGSTDTMQAAVDHVVALGIIREVELARRPAGQDRIFVEVREP
jgi:hypothetical protein